MLLNGRGILLSLQERIATLKKQSSQIALQTQQERENFQREKNNLLVMLQKARTFFALVPVNILWCDQRNSSTAFSTALQEREKLTSLEEKYAKLSEGQTFVNPLTITEVRGNLSVCVCVALEIVADSFQSFGRLQHLHSLKERRRSGKENSIHPSDGLPPKRSQQLLSSYGRSLGRTLPPKVNQDYFLFRNRKGPLSLIRFNLNVSTLDI